MLRRWSQMIRSHPLLDTLFSLKGNPKILLLMEPFWGIPYHLMIPFASLYMYELGVSDVQIGLLISLSTLFQVFFSFFGGMITDKFGRKRTTILGDVLGWVVACTIWAVAQNFWFFLVAMILNCFEQVNQTAWSCLLTEDAPKKSILNIYTWVSIAGLLSVFFAPLSAFFINRYSLIPVVRVLYALFAVSMLIKSIITRKYAHETKQGKRKMEETKTLSLFDTMKQYGGLFSKIFKNISFIRILIVLVSLFVTNQISSNFFSLYATQTLQLPASYMAYFPILRAGLMLILMFTLEIFLNRKPSKPTMLIGLAIYISAYLLLMLAKPHSVALLVAYTLLDALAYSLVVPRKDAMLFLHIDSKERARMTGIMVCAMQFFSIPFGVLSGYLSDFDRRWPFLVGIGMFTIAVISLWGLPKQEDSSPATAQG